MTSKAQKEENLIDGTIPLFDETRFDRWLNGVKSCCKLKSHAGKVLGGVHKDPQTTFALLYPAKYALLTSEQTSTDAEIKMDPSGTLKKFLSGIMAAPAPVEAQPEIQADDENGIVGVAAVLAVEGIDVELKLSVSKQIEDWIAGEQAIFAIFSKALVREKDLQISTVDAGRAQIDFLESYWKSDNT